MNKRGKITLSIIIVSIILASFFSLYFTLAVEDNVKVYDSITKTATIKNGATEISTITLNTPLIHKVMRGKDRLVAEFTIDNNVDDYSNVFENMEFYDVKNNMNKFDREFNYKYKTYNDIEVSDYETVCQERLSGNGSLEKYDCVQNQIGSHIRKDVVWNNFNEKADLPEGSITIGVFTDVEAGERVEWIPTLFGVRIDEWAEWTESLNVGLIAYYDFNESSGNLTDKVRGKHNGTLVGSVNYETTGIIGGAIDFPGSTDYFSVADHPDFNFEINGVYTFSLWLNLDARDSTQRPFLSLKDTGGGAEDTLHLLATKATQDGYWGRSEQSDGTHIGEVALGSQAGHIGNWVHHVVRANGTDWDWWINGDLAYTTSYDGTINDAPKPLFIGAGHEIPANSHNGDMDELGVWNRSLTNSEITDLYNNGSGMTYSTDLIPPTTTTPIITPSSPIANENLECNATLTDNLQTSLTAYWKWYEEGVLNLSGSTAVTNGTNSLITTLNSGNTTKGENWTCEIIPNDGTQTGTAKNITVTIGNTAPSSPIQLLPVNESNYGMGETITFVWNNSNDIDPDSPTITYDLEIYNESNMAAANLIHSNTSITEGTGNTSISITLSDYTTIDDDYYWYVRSYDQTNYSNWSEIRDFQYANWTLIFNLTNSFNGEQIDTSGPANHFDISCSNGFTDTNVENPYNSSPPDSFAAGTWECTFSEINDGKFFDKTQEIFVDNDSTINIPISQADYLSQEEHTWLEAIYNCINGGNCDLYNLLSEVNTTTTNTWKRITKTNRAVVTQEDFISNTLNSTSNLTINYTIDIPYKAGYDNGEYLPLRLFFWFTDAEKTECYNQDKASDTNRVEDPYCFPLMAETLGPNNGSVTFTVDLRPNLADGVYNVTRAIEIDPIVDGKQVWTNYGQEDIGQANVEESNEDTLISFETTGEEFPESGITGAIISAGQYLLSGWQIVIVMAIVGLVLMVAIVSRTKIKLKENN